MQKFNELASLKLDFAKNAAMLLAASCMSNLIEQIRCHMMDPAYLVLLMPNLHWQGKISLRCRRIMSFFGQFCKLWTKNQVHVLWIVNMDIFSERFIVRECIYASCKALPSLVRINQDLGLQILGNGDFWSDTMQHSNVAKCQPHFGLWRYQNRSDLDKIWFVGPSSLNAIIPCHICWISLEIHPWGEI